MSRKTFTPEEITILLANYHIFFQAFSNPASEICSDYGLNPISKRNDHVQIRRCEIFSVNSDLL